MIALALCWVVPPHVYAGLLNRVGSSSSVGLGTAGGGDTTGLNEGAGNVSLNPAALMTVDELDLYLGTTIHWTDFSYNQHSFLGGTHFEAIDDILLAPEIALAWRIDEHWILGAQVWVPYGLGSDYHQMTSTFPGYRSEINLMQTDIAVAYQFNQEFSVAAAVKVAYADLQFRLPTIMNGSFLGHSSSESNGWGVGAGLSLLWKPGAWRFGLNYSLPLSVDIDGDTDFPAALNLGRDHFSSAIHVPQRVAAGIAYQWNDWWISAWDATYTDYEQNDDLSLRFDHIPAESIPLQWESVWSLHAGNQFHLTDRFTFKQGLGWMSSGAPDDTLLPSIPDTPGWIVSTGFGYALSPSLQLDLSLAYAWGDRTIGFSPSRVASGDMKSNIWLLGIGIHWAL